MAAQRGKRVRVFVSHATADKWLATTICEKIEACGATTFRDDRDIDGGDDIPDRIRDELQSATELVVLLTPDSVDRPWVLLEIGAFWGNQEPRRIVPILCHAPIEKIPGMIKSKKAIHLNEFDQYLTELRNRMKRART